MSTAQSVLETRAQIRRRTRISDCPKVRHDAGGSDFSGMMSAHPVGNQPKSVFGVNQKVVLVKLPDAAPVGYAIALEGEGELVHFFTRAFFCSVGPNSALNRKERRVDLKSTHCGPKMTRGALTPRLVLFCHSLDH